MSYLSYEEIKKAIELGKQLEKECKHEYVIETGYESAICSICGKDLGWWCPESPNHICEYYGNHDSGRRVPKASVKDFTKVEPITWDTTGNYVWSYEGEWYDGDDCIYCHQPEERK